MSDPTSNRVDIRRLLDLYYSGEIDEDAAQTLRRLLRAPGLHAEFEADRRLFEALDADIKIPDSARAKIDRDMNRRITASRARRWLSAGIAATVAAMIAISIPSGTEPRHEPTGSFATYTEEQAAIEALTLLATTVRKGRRAVDRATSTTDSIRQKVDRHITIKNEQV